MPSFFINHFIQVYKNKLLEPDQASDSFLEKISQDLKTNVNFLFQEDIGYFVSTIGSSATPENRNLLISKLIQISLKETKAVDQIMTPNELATEFLLFEMANFPQVISVYFQKNILFYNKIKDLLGADAEESEILLAVQAVKDRLLPLSKKYKPKQQVELESLSAEAKSLIRNFNPDDQKQPNYDKHAILKAVDGMLFALQGEHKLPDIQKLRDNLLGTMKERPYYRQTKSDYSPEEQCLKRALILVEKFGVTPLQKPPKELSKETQKEEGNLFNFYRAPTDKRKRLIAKVCEFYKKEIKKYGTGAKYDTQIELLQLQHAVLQNPLESSPSVLSAKNKVYHDMFSRGYSRTEVLAEEVFKLMCSEFVEYNKSKPAGEPTEESKRESLSA